MLGGVLDECGGARIAAGGGHRDRAEVAEIVAAREAQPLRVAGRPRPPDVTTPLAVFTQHGSAAEVRASSRETRGKPPGTPAVATS